MLKRILLLAVMLAGHLLAASTSGAASLDSSLVLQAEVVQPFCAVADAMLDFGTYDAGRPADLDASARIEFVDRGPGTLHFELDGGQSGNEHTRQLRNGAAALTYQLFRDSNRTLNFGAGSSARVIALAERSTDRVKIHARIPGGQDIAPGLYTDTVRVTLSF